MFGVCVLMDRVWMFWFIRLFSVVYIMWCCLIGSILVNVLLMMCMWKCFFFVLVWLVCLWFLLSIFSLFGVSVVVRCLWICLIIVVFMVGFCGMV